MPPIQASRISSALMRVSSARYNERSGQVQSGDKVILLLISKAPWLSEYGTLNSSGAQPNPPGAFQDPSNEVISSTVAALKRADLIRGVQQQLRAATSKGADQVQTIDLGSFGRSEEITPSEVFDAVKHHSYDMLALNAIDHIAIMVNDTTGRYSHADIRAAIDEFDTGNFLATYFRAYFRSGQLYQVSVDTQALNDKLDKHVLHAIDNSIVGHSADEAVKAAVKSAIDESLSTWCKDTNGKQTKPCLLTPALGSDKFVTRSGMSVQFAGLTLEFDKDGKTKPSLTHPKASEYGPQMVRVFVEAVFDANGTPVPAGSNSTACQKQLYTGSLCVADDSVDGSGSSDLAKRLGVMDGYASQAEATVSAITASAIRGASWASLNNEAIADTVETAAGVTARKVMEKGLWPYYETAPSCGSSIAPVTIDVSSK